MCAAIQFDPALKQLLLRRTGTPLGEGLPQEDALVEVPVLAKLRDPSVPAGALRVISRLGEVVAVRRHPNVYSLKASRTYYAAGQDIEHNGDSAAGWPAEAANSAAGSYDGARAPERLPDPLGATGRGVVLGVVGWGLDFAHSNFRHADGSTRLLCIWDQRGGPHPSSPGPFGYGREFSSEQINRA